jgi:two-component system, chemotaxis family, sensor kinase Cph1
LGDPTEVDLNKCVTIAETNLKTLIQDRHAEVYYNNLPYAKAHSSLIVLLFQNLITNGLKYNKSAVPKVEIGVDMSNEEDIIFWVRDNGIGIAAENHAKIFSMFRRLHAQSEYEGTGIGLAFCTRIVNTYGGQIWLDSEIDKGSTFYFTLPKVFPYIQKSITTLKVA